MWAKGTRQGSAAELLSPTTRQAIGAGQPEVRLALTLCAVAGAVNAGGFMLVGQYTSHMSGVVSSLADNLAVGAGGLALFGLLSLGCFVAGAACAAVLINWGRRQRRPGHYARPLRLEAALLLLFGLLGALAPRPLAVAGAVPLLCFLMGLQNATITKQSGARLRTTHMTGIVTDIGIELGKLFYWNRGAPEPGRLVVRADRAKLLLLTSMLGCFLMGGLTGAIGFGRFGFVCSVPLAAVLLAAAWLLPLPDEVAGAGH